MKTEADLDRIRKDRLRTSVGARRKILEAFFLDLQKVMRRAPSTEDRIRLLENFYLSASALYEKDPTT